MTVLPAALIALGGAGLLYTLTGLAFGHRVSLPAPLPAAATPALASPCCYATHSTHPLP